MSLKVFNIAALLFLSTGGVALVTGGVGSSINKFDFFIKLFFAVIKNNKAKTTMNLKRNFLWLHFLKTDVTRLKLAFQRS